MQGKVSMVMPCYNKVEYIGIMFDSIIAQDWDNIELILVNDGSTDGTRDVISEYESKFISRGYSVVIVDQENAGVCAAAKAGLERVSGDYVCMVDSDDELDPEYVSTMAGWLEENTDYDFCICDTIIYTLSDGLTEYEPFLPRRIAEGERYLVERYLLMDMRTTVWIYMSRASYLKKCGIPEAYFTDTPGSHEPGFVIPLLAYGVKYKYFDLPLYRFNNVGDGHSRPTDLQKKISFCDEYSMLCIRAVECISDSVSTPQHKTHFIKISEFMKYVQLYQYMKDLPDCKEVKNQIYHKWISAVNSLLVDKTCFINDGSQNMERGIIQAGKKFFLYANRIKRTVGRTIAWGVLGKRGREVLQYLKGVGLEPDELWDKNGDGVTIKKPYADSLNSNDLVLILPVKQNIIDEMTSKIKETHCGVILSLELLKCMPFLKYLRLPDTEAEYTTRG